MAIESVAEGTMLWTPSPQRTAAANVTQLLTWLKTHKGLELADYHALWTWSVHELDAFWACIWQYFDVQASVPYTTVLSTRRMPGATWFAGAELNYTQHVLRNRPADGIALVFESELCPMTEITWGQLTRQVAAVAATLSELGVDKGDRVVSYMPNMPETVVVFLAVASVRKSLTAQQPKLRRGRPSTPAAKQAARTKKRLEAQRAGLFTHRYLFVQRHLNKTKRKTLWRITRDLPQLRTLRTLMEQVYALFDRRCRTQTALDKLAKLRRRLLRFTPLGETLKKLFSPTLEKALTFLDDKLLPSTSNAVERGNRRYRKMQKQVYRVRTQAQVSARLALDMWREAQGAGRHQTLHTLHEARAA